MKNKSILILLALFSFIQTNIAQEQVTFEQFGAKGNGKDETRIILAALSHAKEKKLPVNLSGGKKYIFSPQQTVDITGIPAINGNGTIDASGAGPNAGNEQMNYLFRVSGKKILVQAGVTGINKGINSVTLKPGLNLSTGDILFITSIEPLPNNKRKYNRKGQRAIVNSYNRNSGVLTIKDSFYFDIEKAYIWKQTEQPVIEIEKGIHFVTSAMNFMSCIELQYAKGKISGSYDNFALAAIFFRSSEGEVENAVINLPVNKNNGYSYGVAVSDMSDVIIKNSTIDGGRHAITGTSGGLWTEDESGGNGKEKLGYPATLIIDGGTYKTTYDINAGLNEHLGTIDSHGSVYKVTIKNCTVYGGISLGADYGEVDNVIIYTNSKRAFNLGSDVSPGSDWGHYNISNTAIKISNDQQQQSLLFGKSDIKELNLSSVTVHGTKMSTVVMDFKDYAPGKFNINKLRIFEISDPKIWINDKSTLSLENSDVDRQGVKRIKRTPLPPQE